MRYVRTHGTAALVCLAAGASLALGLEATFVGQ